MIKCSGSLLFLKHQKVLLNPCFEFFSYYCQACYFIKHIFVTWFPLLLSMLKAAVAIPIHISFVQKKKNDLIRARAVKKSNSIELGYVLIRFEINSKQIDSKLNRFKLKLNQIEMNSKRTQLF
jgi:hypothetical protein